MLGVKSSIWSPHGSIGSSFQRVAGITGVRGSSAGRQAAIAARPDGPATSGDDTGDGTGGVTGGGIGGATGWLTTLALA